jgi:hypothetical protein
LTGTPSNKLLIYQVPNNNPVIWAKGGKDRFYFDLAFNTATKTFSALSEEAVNYSPPDSSLRDSSIREIARPLRTLDLFSGCGGLSHGLERSGCAKAPML